MYLHEVIEHMHQGINTVADQVVYQESGIPIIQSKNFTKGFLDLEDVRYLGREDEEKYCLKYTPHIGDILMANIGTIGKSLVVKEERRFLIAWNVFLIKPIKEKVNSDFLKYYFGYLADTNYFDKLLTGGTVKFINKKKIGEIIIPDYFIEEQSEIVLVLSKVEQVILKKQQQLEELDNLIKSRFVELFGDPQINPLNWDVVNISEVVGGKVSNGFFAKRDDYVDDGNVSVLGVTNIVNRMYSKIDELPKTNAGTKDIEKFEVKYGDMLFCRSSLVAEGIGKASIIPEDVQEKVLFECHVIRLPLDLSKCVPEFMQVLSTMEYFRNQVIAQSKTSTMTTIGQDGILKTDIILPPIEKQRAFYESWVRRF